MLVRINQWNWRNHQPPQPRNSGFYRVLDLRHNLVGLVQTHVPIDDHLDYADNERSPRRSLNSRMSFTSVRDLIKFSISFVNSGSWNASSRTSDDSLIATYATVRM